MNTDSTVKTFSSTSIPQSGARKRWSTLGMVAALLLINAGLVLYSLRHNFACIDEVAHLAAGVAQWETGDFAPYRVNPPLVRMLATLPVTAAKPVTDYSDLRDFPGDRAEWELGHEFMKANATRYFDLLCLARLAGVAWSMLGGLLVFCWACELYGTGGGILALLLWCFSPNILAFAQLIVPDVPATVAGLAATYSFWRYLRAPSWERAFLAGLLLGLAQLTKYTLLIFYGVWPLLGLLWLVGPKGTQLRRVGWCKLAVQGLLVVLLSIYVINSGYAFKGTFKRLGDYPFVSRLFGGVPPEGFYRYESGLYGNRFRDTWMEHLMVPLPEDFLRGIDVQRVDFEKGLNSYLAGEWRHEGEGGWWYYYLYALVVKVPLGTWGLVLANLVLTIGCSRFRAAWCDEVVLALPAAAILALVSSQTGFNHHMRYVLPMFPFVMVSAGKLAYFIRAVCWPAALVILALLGWALGSCLLIYPHTMSYFNELAGGPENGAAHLVDSNIDWGQDLLYLKDWLEQHPECRPLHLAYFGLVDPRILGINFTLPPPGPTAFHSTDDLIEDPMGPMPGWHAASVNFVYGLEYNAPDGQGGVHHNNLRTFEYFQSFTPVARAGYSILIYHITLDEANAVRHRLGLEEIRTERP
jgi:4-amino-4-deoxy-L-arabinose transferase-like glycosyltransferase